MSGSSEQPDEMLKQLAEEYKGFPSSLDNITSFLLLVNTFALGFVQNTFAGKVSSFDLLTQLILLAAISFLLLSVTFGVLALLPRSITPPDVGALKIRTQRSDDILQESKGVLGMPADEKERLWPRYLKEHYRTTNPKIALIERVYALRAMVAKKIAWVNRSIVTLLVGLGLLVPLTFADSAWQIYLLVILISISIGVFLFLWLRPETPTNPAANSGSGVDSSK